MLDSSGAKPNPILMGALAFCVLSLFLLIYIATSKNTALMVQAVQTGQLYQVDLATGKMIGKEAAKVAPSETKDAPVSTDKKKIKETPTAKTGQAADSAKAKSSDNKPAPVPAKEQAEKKPAPSLVDEVMKETQEVMKASHGKPFALDALLERTDAGMLPVVGPKGKRSADAYAREITVSNQAIPLGVIVTGIGLRSSVFDKASALPAVVGIGMSPYSQDAIGQAKKMHQAGHELWLGLAAQREDYPASDPGPQGILLDSTTEERLARLRTTLTAMQGYVGMYSDAKEIVSNELALFAPILAEIEDRGLYTMIANRDSKAARDRLIQADANIMTVSQYVGRNILSPLDLSKRFELAEQRAKQAGKYLLMVEASPLTLRSLEKWLPTLESRGFAVVPPSQIYRMKAEEL